MKKNLRKIGMFALAITVLSSCKKDNIDDIYVAGNYEDGYFVTNEGNFGTGNGSISFVDEYGAVENNVFASINSFALGDVVQSMNIINDNAYIVVNNSKSFFFKKICHTVNTTFSIPSIFFSFKLFMFNKV